MEVATEKIKPYKNDNRQKKEQVEEMFDNIAHSYDNMNRAMTMGIDIAWRKKAAKMIAKSQPCDVLDIAAGTADLSLAIADKIPTAKIIGVDLSENMVEIGRRKVQKAGKADNISLMIADCLDMPFDNDSFDCITSAFGVRNFQNLLQGYKEMHRVMRPGGMLCIVEMSKPESRLIRPLYNLYAKHLIPLVGKIVSKDNSAYAYLPESIDNVPQSAAMCSLIEAAGFKNARYRTMTFGTCSIYTAVK